MSSIAGELVSETFEYDGGRPVTVYVPPVPPEVVVYEFPLMVAWAFGRRD